MSIGETILYGIILVIVVLVTAGAIIVTFYSDENIGTGVVAAGGLVAVAVLMHGNILSATLSAKRPDEDNSKTDTQ